MLELSSRSSPRFIEPQHVADTTTSREVLVGLSADSREQVDDLVRSRQLAAGAQARSAKPDDHGIHVHPRLPRPRRPPVVVHLHGPVRRPGAVIGELTLRAGARPRSRRAAITIAATDRWTPRQTAIAAGRHAGARARPPRSTLLVAQRLGDDQRRPASPARRRSTTDCALRGGSATRAQEHRPRRL